MNWKSHKKRASMIGVQCTCITCISDLYRLAYCSQKFINDAADGVNFDEPHRLHVPLKCYNVIICLPFTASHDFDFEQTKDNDIRTMPTNPRNKQTSK